MVLKTQFLTKEIIKSEYRTTLSKDKGLYAICWKKDFDALPVRSYLEIGIGDAGLKRDDEGDIDSRLKQHCTSKNVFEDLVEIGRWTDLTRIQRDHDIFDSMGLVAPRREGINRSGKRAKHELFRLPIAQAMINYYIKTKDFSQIIDYVNQRIDTVIKDKEKISKTELIKFRDIQIKVIDRIIKKLRINGFNMSLVAELCPRIGKTIIFLELFRRINKEHPEFKTMFIQVYGVGLSIFKSYKDELDRWKDFVGMDLIDSSQADAEQQFKNSQKQNRLQVVLVGLNPEENSKRYKWMNLYKGAVVSLLEEADFGCHTDQQITKTQFLNSNKKKLIRINASGTNIGRLAKAFGDNIVMEVIVVPYSMVEQDRDARKNGIVQRKYYNAFFDQKINKLLEGYDPEDLPTIRKIVENPWAQEAWLGAVWGDILGSPTSRMSYGLSINQMAEEDLKYVMVFQSGTKKSMNQQKEVIEKHCPEHHVLVLHGDMPGMNNKTAQQLTKEKIVELQYGMIPGKSKLLVLTNMMGSRSYTVGEIQAVIFMQDGGDIDTFIQKSSRVLSPHPGKKFGHIFDFAFDPNKTRNLELAIVHDAVLTQNIVGGSFPQAIRQVLNSVKLYDMGRGGWQNDDQLVVSLEDNNKLLALANSSNRLDIKNLSAQQLDILSKIQNSFTNKEKKKLKHIMTGKTFKSTGRVGKGDIDIVLKQVRKAIQSLNNSATSVVWFADKQGDTFADCIELIKNNKEASADFTKVIGITPAEVQQLIPILPTNIYDICVKNSRNGQGQKYATNNSLGILGQPDSKELWMEIISQAVMDARIRYAIKHHGKILVIAGGHGTEVDVLVEKYGRNIVKNIWFNDDIISFANEIKFKYNKINIIKSNFLEINIDMKFDVILGNPPYQDNSTGKSTKTTDLYSKFFYKCIKHLKKDGIISMIIPSDWVGPNNSVFKKYIFNSKQIKEICFHPYQKYFKIKKETCNITLDKTYFGLCNIVDINGKSKLFDLSQQKFLSTEFSRIEYREFFSKYPSMGHRWLRGKLNRNKVKKTSKGRELILGCGFVNKPLDIVKISPNLENTGFGTHKIVIPNVGGTNGDLGNNIKIAEDYHVGGHSVVFLITKSKKESKNLLAFLNTKPIKALIRSVKKSSPNSKVIFQQIPDVDLSINWDDDKVYKHFNFSKEMIDNVEKDY
jgi:hypothetical protein